MDLLAARVLQAQRHHRVHLGADARAGRWARSSSRASSPRGEALALAEPAGDRRHRHREADRGGRPAQPPRRSTSASWARCSCSSPRPACAPSFPATSRRPDRCRPPRRWRCACSWPCRCSASRTGLGGYLKSYVEPTVIMLPFNIISELSRTLALAVRLFGNMMSGAMIVAILLTITPFIFPDRHDGARPAHRHGAGLHLQHPGGGLHRGRDAHRAPKPPQRGRQPQPETTQHQPKDSPWTA
jgi:hypothetical protein